jgi:hypothetical protein
MRTGLRLIDLEQTDLERTDLEQIALALCAAALTAAAGIRPRQNAAYLRRRKDFRES